jgi:type 1 fimbria pilin
MKKKLSLLAAVLALATVSFASAKTYNVSLTHPAIAGKQQLTPGDYRVKVDGGNAVFTDLKTSKSFTVPVKIETGDKKFRYTAVDSTAEGGTERINAIELGGSTTKLEFAASTASGN